MSRQTRLRAALIVGATSLFACPRAAEHPLASPPSAAFTSATSTASAPSLATAAGSASASREPNAAHASQGPWHVELFEKGSTFRAPSAVESWGELAHQWRRDSPDGINAERTMCFAKGTYIFEQASSPSLDTSVIIDARSVLTQHDFPTEISRPIALDGCVTVRVELRNPLHFHNISFHWGVREAAQTETCDSASFPMTHWNACMFHGRNREEMLERGTWSKLEVPKGRPGGNHGSFDWYSIEARRKVCFEPGSYIFHAKTDETLEVRVRDARVLQTAPDRLPPTIESEVVKLAGCQEVTVVHSYRYDTSVLDLAWAKVGSTVDRRWAVERACAFRCREGTTCTTGESLVPPRRGEHICVPTSRPGYEGEYCDAKHPCGPRSGICTVVHGCYQL